MGQIYCHHQSQSAEDVRLDGMDVQGYIYILLQTHDSSEIDVKAYWRLGQNRTR